MVGSGLTLLGFQGVSTKPLFRASLTRILSEAFLALLILGCRRGFPPAATETFGSSLGYQSHTPSGGEPSPSTIDIHGLMPYEHQNQVLRVASSGYATNGLSSAGQIVTERFDAGSLMPGRYP